jgi:hypothetical protein
METTPSIPAKLELMEICVEMLFSETMERSESPALQIRENAMDAFETHVGRKSIFLAEVGWEMLSIGNANI